MGGTSAVIAAGRERKLTGIVTSVRGGGIITSVSGKGIVISVRGGGIVTSVRGGGIKSGVTVAGERDNKMGIIHMGKEGGGLMYLGRDLQLYITKMGNFSYHHEG